MSGLAQGEGGRSLTMSAEFRKSLHELRKHGALNDVIITLAGGERFEAHRIIMAGFSGYFRALFTTNLGRRIDCYMPEISAEVMSTLLEFIYLGHMTLTDENVIDVFLAADYLAISGASDTCCNYLVSALNSDNCIPLYQFARFYSIEKLTREAWNYIMIHFTEVLTLQTEFLKLEKDDVIQILSSDTLNVKSEENVWEAIIAWIQEKEERCVSVVELLRCVRLGLLDPQYFLENVRDHSLIANNEECRPIVIDTLRHLFGLDVVVEEMSNTLPIEMACPRLPHQILFAIGGWSGGSPTNCIEVYDSKADRWSVVDESDPKGPRAYHGTAVVDSNIYLIGGYDGQEYFNSCRCYNTIAHSWRDISPMNKSRCYVSVAVLGNFIYAMGGFNGTRRQNSAERYDIRNNQWNMIGEMNEARSDASAAALDGTVYIFGGFNGQECLSSVEMYNPHSDSWTNIPSMSVRRSGVSSAVYKDYIYVLGGFNGMSRMSSGEKYDPSRRTWRNISNMIHARSNFALAVVDDQMFAVGGFNGVTTTSDVDCYNPHRDEWSSVNALNLNRSALSCCVVSNLPNITDYSYKGRDTLIFARNSRELNHKRAENSSNSERNSRSGNSSRNNRGGRTTYSILRGRGS